MNKISIGVLSFLLGIFFILGDVSLSNAQGSDIDEFTLEEITVTAQKREENQQKVAIAMEVLSGEDLKELGKNDLDDILGTISSVMMQTAEDGLRVVIRGMSNDNSPFQNINISTPTVAVNTDGVYTNRNTGNQNLFDIERMEVLFGPQSTVYASASPGGIVNIVTANPKTDKYEVSGVLEYGNYNLLHTEGVMNAPLSDTKAIRASFSTAQHDGYLTNGSNDEDIKSARLKTLFQPNDIFSVVLTGEIQKKGGAGFASVDAFANQDATDNPWTSAEDSAATGMDKDYKKISGNIDWDLGPGTLTIVPSYVTEEGTSSGTTTGMAMEGTEAPTYDTYTQSRAREKGVELRVASNDDFPFQWILGGNWYESRDDQAQQNYAQTEGTDDRLGKRYNIQRIKAAFGNVTYPVTDQLRLSGGVRMTTDTNFTYNWEYPGQLSEYTIQSCEVKYSDPDFNVGFEYDVSDNSMFYADFTTSYRVSGNANSETEILPEELKAYTMGSKNRFFGNKLQLNVSAYYYDYTNFHANAPPLTTMLDENENGIWDYDPVTGEGETNQDHDGGCQQRAQARVVGFDIQTSTIITEQDKLDFSVSYIKKEFKSLLFDFDPITNYLGLEDIDYSGREMPQAPNWNAKASYEHNFNITNGGLLAFRLDGTYTSDYNINWIAYQPSISVDLDTGVYSYELLDVSDVRYQEAYYLADASIVYTNPDGKWSLSGYVKNIQNYAVKRFMDGMGNMFIGDPRTYGAVLTVRY